MVDRFKNWDDYIDPRIEELTKAGFYLEAFYLYSATIEHSLQDAVRYQEEWIEHVLYRGKLKFQRTGPDALKDKTLGQLIIHFARYCEDPALVSQLNEFNSFRKKFVHKLMDYPITQLNDEAKGKRNTYYQLVSKITRYNMKILGKLIKTHTREIKRVREGSKS